jgi:predicted dehydrogenase
LSSSEIKSALIVGAGSIGRRHISNLKKLGLSKLAACDPHPERLEYVAKEFQVECFPTIEVGLDKFEADAVLVCSPPAGHVAQAMQGLQAGAHVFIEKPLSDRMDGVEALRDEAAKRQAVVQVGYNLRFHPGLQTLKRVVEQEVAGRILWARAEVAQYLPDWRPWQDYRESYTARCELGGGIILDASHEIDYMLWLLGPPRELTCMAGQVSGLEVNVEDCATMLIRLRSGAQADIHMDFVQRTPSRSCVVAGDQARLEWEHAKNQVRIIRPSGGTEVINYEFESNQMYVAEIQEFFSSVRERVTANRSLAESELTLKVALAALTSAGEQKWVTFE